MAQVITSSIPTDTLFDISTITSESTFRSRARVTEVTTITSEDIVLDDDGDLVPTTVTVESDVVSTSTSTGTRTYTRTSSIPIETLYSVSRSTSTVDDDDEDESTTSTSSTTSLSPIRRPLQPTLSATTSEDDGGDVVVVTQFTTITPSIESTATDLPTLASSSSSSSRNAVFPGGASSSLTGANANADNAASSRSSSGTSLSTGAIAGITIGAIAIAILLGILAFLFCCRSKRKNKRDSMYATTGGQSDEKLATALFSNPDYSHSHGRRYQDDSSPRRMPSNANGNGNGRGQRQLMMANVGGAGTSSIGAGTAGVGAAGSYRNNSKSNGNGRRISGTTSTAPPAPRPTGKNKPVPDVPPPISNLYYSRSPPPLQQGRNQEGYPSSAAYYGLPAAAAATAGMMGRPSTASPNLATQSSRNVPGGHNNRTSAPVFMNNNHHTNHGIPTPVQTPQERANALKRAKSVASIKSIPPENLGKGAGYASPMPPLDPLGKPIDQKTWRERQSKVKSGINFSPDTILTPEQKIRRDSQIAKLNALRDGTASSKPGLSNLQEREEPVETSPLLDQGDGSFDNSMMSSPEKVSSMMLPVRATTSRNSGSSNSKQQERNMNRNSETILPYAAPQAIRPPRASSFSAPSTSQPQSQPQYQPQPPRSPPPSAIYPSLPPNSPRKAQGTHSPVPQPRYELHQPLTQSSYGPIRASFASAPLSSSTNAGPPPAQSSQAFNTRLPAIPGSRPCSMITASTALPEYRRSSTASYTNNTPYAVASNLATQQQTSSPNPLFHHRNGSNNSFGQSSNSRIVPSTSIADDIYGGLTHGLSDRDLARLSESQQAGRK